MNVILYVDREPKVSRPVCDEGEFNEYDCDLIQEEALSKIRKIVREVGDISSGLESKSPRWNNAMTMRRFRT